MCAEWRKRHRNIIGYAGLLAVWQGELMRTEKETFGRNHVPSVICMVVCLVFGSRCFVSLPTRDGSDA